MIYNRTLLGAGKLSNGETMCSDCYLRLNNIDSKFVSNSKSLSPDQVKDIFSNKESKLDRIKQQLKNIGIDKTSAILGRKEIAELPNIIAEGETIFGLVQGIYNNGQGILVATDRRLLFVDKGLIYGIKVEDFGLDKVSSIQYETGMIMADIKIMASGNVAKITHVDKGPAREFCEQVRKQLSTPKANIASVPVLQNQVDVADQIEKFARLKDQGILTQEEFDNQKKKLLGL